MARPAARPAPLLLLSVLVSVGAASAGQSNPRELQKASRLDDAPEESDEQEAGGRGETKTTVAAVSLPFVSDSDRDLAMQLAMEEKRHCSHPFQGDVSVFDSAEASEGGNNLKEALKAEDFDFMVYARHSAFQDTTTLLALILAALMLAAWVLLCMQYRFMCCRCGSHKRVSKFWFKMVVWVVLLVLCALLGYFSLYRVVTLHSEVKVGVDNFLCSSTGLTSVTLNGHRTEPLFPGVFEPLKCIEDVAVAMQESEGPLKEIDEIREESSEIYKSSLVARDTLRLLDDLSGGSVTGICPLCEEMDTLRPAALAALEDTPGYKLGQTRVEEFKLSRTERNRLNASMSNAAGPLLELKDQVMHLRESLSGAQIYALKVYVDLSLVALVVLICVSIICALALVLMGLYASSLYLCKETVRHGGNSQEGREDGIPPNPYNESVHKWAARTWCLGIAYCVVTLLTYAAMSGVLVPAAESCQILSSKTEVSPLLDFVGARLAGKEDVDHMTAIVENCVTDVAEPVLLMDLLHVQGGGKSLPMRKQLGEDVGKAVNDLYGDLVESLNAERAVSIFLDDMKSLVEVFRRGDEDLKRGLPDEDFSCDLFDWSEMGVPECDPAIMADAGGCLTGRNGQDYGRGMIMKRAPRTCKRDAYVVYLKEMEARITKTLQKFDSDVSAHQPAMRSKWAEAYQNHIEGLMSSLETTTDCRYIGAYYKELVVGLCYQSLPAVNDMASALMLSGYLSAVLVVVMYFLWRAAKDNWDHFNDPPEEAKANLHEQEKLVREADNENPLVGESKD